MSKPVRDILAEAAREIILQDGHFTPVIMGARKAFNGEELRRQADKATRELILWLLDPSKPFDRGERRALAELLAGETHTTAGRPPRKASDRQEYRDLIGEAKAYRKQLVKAGMVRDDATVKTIAWARRDPRARTVHGGVKAKSVIERDLTLALWRL